jgi:hypothetical protein
MYRNVIVSFVTSVCLKGMNMATQKVGSEWSTIDLSPNGDQKKVEFEIEGQEDKSDEQKKAQTSPETETKVARTEGSSDTQSNGTQGNSDQNHQSTSEAKELDGIETRGAQKRIRQLIKQRKEREEEISKLREEVSNLRASVQVREKELSTSLKTTIDSTESQLKTRIDSAKDLFKRAAESSDTDGMLKAQEEMSRAYAEMTQIRQRRQDLEDYTSRVEQQEKAVSGQQQTQQKTQYDPKAIDWASKNEWFGKDQIMTNAALLIDAQLKQEGFDPSDDEYYDEVDSRLSRQFPQKFKNLKVEEKEDDEDSDQSKSSTSSATKEALRPSQVVSGASRTSKAQSSSRGNKVKLTQEDVRLAQKWGIPLEKYAAEKLKAEQANGDYTPI